MNQSVVYRAKIPLRIYADITIPRCIHVVPCIVRKLRVERINIGDEERKVNRVKSRVKCASFVEIEVV